MGQMARVQFASGPKEMRLLGRVVEPGIVDGGWEDGRMGGERWEVGGGKCGDRRIGG